MLMEVDSDSCSEMWGERYKTTYSVQKEISSSSSNSDSDVPLANVKKKAELAKRQKKRRRRMNGSSESSDSESDNHGQGHSLSLDNESRYKCEECGKQLISKAHLRQHSFTHLPSGPSPDLNPAQNSEGKSVHSDQKRWSCDGCPRLFLSERTLTRHRTSFPGLHNFTCEHCGSTFLKEKLYAKHLAAKHPPSLNSTAKVTCEVCGSPFTSSEQLQEHVEKVHEEVSAVSGNKQYSCALCGKEFFSEEGLIYHETNQHKDEKDRIKPKRKILKESEGQDRKPITCKICFAVLSTKLALQSHLKTHNVKKNMELRTGNFRCIICPRSFSSSDGLKYHLATHTGERRYGCSQCDRRFIKKTHLSEHIATHSDVKFFKCKKCPRTFSTLSAYKKHVKLFPDAHSFCCDKCGKIFMKESMLEKHLCVDLMAVALAPEVVAQLSEDMIEEYMCLAEEADSEAGVQNHQLSCYKCFQMFPTEDALHQHQREHQGKQAYRCRFCRESFNRADSFSAHIVNHIGSTPYMCRQCNRKFISPFTLATHLKNYPGEHSFTCPRCKRWFPSVERRDKHDCILQSDDLFYCACKQSFSDWNGFLCHFGKKPFKCCSCSQEFVTLLPLTRHIKRHTGDRPFTCRVCGKSFLTKSYHLAHLKVHQSETLQCNMCDYKTKYKKRLDFHLKKRHEILPSSSTLCPLCGVLFSNIDDLKKHIDKDHGNVVAIAGDETTDKKPLPTELCTLCGKMLTNKYSLKSHMKAIHSGVKSKVAKAFRCEVCGEEFRRANQLEKHCDQHEEPGLRPCPICQVTCNSRKDLRKHMRKHDTNKPYSCERCNKRFKVAVSLKYHSTICGRTVRRKKEEPLEIPIFNEFEPVFIAPIGTRLPQW